MFLLTHYVQFEIGQKKASFYILYDAVICIASEGTASREAAIHVFLYPENSESAVMMLHIDNGITFRMIWMDT